MPMIDKQKAIEEIENKFCAECSGYYRHETCHGCDYGYCIESLREMPENHSNWIDRDGIMICAKCGAEFATTMPFCGMCGAEMDGDSP